jgi:hypothetical protein
VYFPQSVVVVLLLIPVLQFGKLKQLLPVLLLTDPTAVANLANALRTAAGYTIASGGNTWNVATGCVAGSSPCGGSPGVVLHVNNTSCTCDGANSTYYTVRPEINNDAWGGSIR